MAECKEIKDKKECEKRKDCTTYVRNGVTRCRKLPKGTKKPSPAKSPTPSPSPPSTPTYNEDEFGYYMNKSPKQTKKQKALEKQLEKILENDEDVKKIMNNKKIQDLMKDGKSEKKFSDNLKKGIHYTGALPQKKSPHSKKS